MEIAPITRYDKTLTAPPDKSITHRAVLFNALSGGRATVYNPLMGEDCMSTVECMLRLGIDVETDARGIRLRGGQIGSAALDAGNSGTTMRLLMGALSSRPGNFCIDGDASLRRRPMGRVAVPLEAMGAKITLRRGCAPVQIEGADLVGITYRSPVASAQVKSAILLAGLSAVGVTRFVEPVVSRDHTERMLRRMGADLTVDGTAVAVRPGRIYPVDVTVCGDISAAAFPLILAACVPGGRVTVKNVGVNPTRDGVLEVLRNAGTAVTFDNFADDGEPVADVTLTHGDLKPFRIDGAIVPRLIDEIPALAVLACFIEGESVIAGATELKVKESNRIDTTVGFLRALGADVEPTHDGMIIHGKGYLPGGGTVDPGLDHRTAMAAAIAMAASKRGGTLLNPEVCAVSYPDFYGDVL